MGEVDKMVNISSIQGMQRRKMIFISVISYHLLTIYIINYVVSVRMSVRACVMV